MWLPQTKWAAGRRVAQHCDRSAFAGSAARHRCRMIRAGTYLHAPLPSPPRITDQDCVDMSPCLQTHSRCWSCLPRVLIAGNKIVLRPGRSIISIPLVCTEAVATASIDVDQSSPTLDVDRAPIVHGHGHVPRRVPWVAGVGIAAWYARSRYVYLSATTRDIQSSGAATARPLGEALATNKRVQHAREASWEAYNAPGTGLVRVNTCVASACSIYAHDYRVNSASALSATLLLLNALD